MPPRRTVAENTNVFFIVDRSAGFGRRRLRRRGSHECPGFAATSKTLIDQYPGARFAMIAFASRPSLDWPLSEDAWSLRPEVARLTPYPASDDDEDVNAAAAANVLRYQLIAAGQQYPDSESLVFYFGSGAAGSRAPQGEFDPSTGSVDGGAVFGYGAARNGAGLRDIAEQLGLPYVDRDDGRPIAEAAPGSGGTTAGASGASTPSGVADRTELYWVFTLLAAVLLLFELFASIRDVRRTQTGQTGRGAVTGTRRPSRLSLRRGWCCSRRR